ncbi:AroM family protein [Antarctobacter sp.]|uniref:AroM family protein n=1 Tax=Antarctobacter sp. TaxID=1872577 RepID=UPI003A911C2D
MQISPDPPTPRVLVVTIGHSPRPDLIDEVFSRLKLPLDATELGLLDGLSGTEIDEMRAGRREPVIVTSLANGATIELSRAKTAQRAFSVIAAIPPGAYALVVLMTTGIFRDLESTCPTVNTQRAVESAIISMAAEGETVGIVFPAERQVGEVDIPALSLFDVRVDYARHGNTADLERAAGALADCAYIVLNSVGFTENDRELVAALTGKPVILPRRIIVSSIQLILSTARQPASSVFAERVQDRVDRLTNRERQVMSLVCEGLSNKAIAQQLDISYKTVEIHRSNVLKKMEAPSSGALIRLVVGAGLT